MRRKEREITDNNKIIEIIDKCDCCRLGFKDEESVYIVPLNFGYKKEDEKIILYFHGSNEGKKVNLIKSQSNIGFEMDTKHEQRTKTHRKVKISQSGVLASGRPFLASGRICRGLQIFFSV